MNRTRTLTLVAALAACTALAASTEAASAHTICDRAHSRTVVQNSTARVYSTGNSDRGALYGCLFANGSTVKLETRYDDGLVESYGWSRVRLAGRFVAWQFTHTDDSCKANCPPGYEPTTYSVNVYDLKRRVGKGINRHSEGNTLRVNSRGALAWLEGLGGGQREVHAWDVGDHRVLDTGAIRGGSAFRLNGSTLSWFEDDAGKTATLGSGPTARS
jgi:hypothetical protein